MSAVRPALLACLALAACSRTGLLGGGDGGSDAAASRCRATTTSDLPGVSLAFPGDAACTFTLAQARAGVAIPYDLRIERDLPDVAAEPHDAGRCTVPGPSGLIVFELLAGGAQRYCLCDTGRCQPWVPRFTTIRQGAYRSAFEWDGVNWSGPSDFGNPKGPPFPAGAYTLEVSARGRWRTPAGAEQAFLVAATLAITLVP